MPESKTRRKVKPHRKRDKVRDARARATQNSQARAETRKLTPGAYRRRRAFAWGLIALGVVIFVQHLISHAGFFTLISPGWDDVVAGYPLAGLLGIAGALLLSKT